MYKVRGNKKNYISMNSKDFIEKKEEKQCCYYNPDCPICPAKKCKCMGIACAENYGAECRDSSLEKLEEKCDCCEMAGWTTKYCSCKCHKPKDPEPKECIHGREVGKTCASCGGLCFALQRIWHTLIQELLEKERERIKKEFDQWFKGPASGEMVEDFMDRILIHDCKPKDTQWEKELKNLWLRSRFSKTGKTQ